jgi:heat shock protein HtpX
MAKKAYKPTLITSEVIDQLDKKERAVYDTVVTIAEQHHITLPEIGIYESVDPNAFATGATKNSSLVAVSTGLLASMDIDEIE